jgi:maleylpyruvate isomerase
MTDLVTAIDDATEALLRTARDLDDPRAASLCDGWTRGHVLSHVARNADAMTTVVRGAVDGPPAPMYPSREARDADVDAGADRDLSALVADLASSADTLSDELPRLADVDDDATFERTPGGPVVPVGAVPFMRLREVVFHHVDLDAGFTFADVASDQARMFVEDAVRRLDARGVDVTVRTQEGDELVAGNGGPVVTGTRAAALLWLARRDPSGVSSDGDIPDLPHGG